MEGSSELRASWEFPATWKALQLLSTPLSFSVPTPTQLEEALLNSRENTSLLADIHGRLLGLSTGTSAAKKWLATISRFIRQRPHEFSHFLNANSATAPSKDESSTSEVKEEPREVSEHRDDIDRMHSVVPADIKPFPREEEDYCQLHPITRLLVLHTIAEIVLSEHDILLCAGSIGDIPIEDMRIYPIGSDAVSNNYYYFGDEERVYREPGRKVFKTRLQKAEEDARAAEKAAKEAVRETARLEKEEKRKQADRVREEARRKREEKKRKSMERWAPRVAATRTTRASRRAQLSLIEGSTNSAQNSDAFNEFQRNAEEESVSRPLGRQRTESSTSQDTLGKKDPIETRISDQRRKSSCREDLASVSRRTQKRPRRGETFEDPTLRDCDEWQLFSCGADALRNVLGRFQPDMVTVLPSEKVLVRRLEEEVLPGIEEHEEKIRKEQEKIERKKRNELWCTYTKRSSRVQALEQKREEAAKRAAEEEERERELEEKKMNRAEAIKAQVAILERDQARDIATARQAHGRTEAIARDEKLQLAADRKTVRDVQADSATVRRSSRSKRASRHSSRVDPESSPIRESFINTRSSRHAQETVRRCTTTAENGVGLQGVNDADEVNDNTSGHVDAIKRTQIEVDDKCIPGTKTKEEHKEALSTVEEPEFQQQDCEGFMKNNSTTSAQLSSAASEDAIDESYTWSTNPEDGEPIRVLEKFFFASKANFEDAPLERLDANDTQIIGFGILLPSFNSDARAQRVELGKVEEWVIEYGAEPKIWTKSPNAWYELREPAIEYQTAFAFTRKKYEMCIRISILGTSYKAADLSYSSVVELLGFRYNEMLSLSEAQILKEKRFILSQMESLNIKPLMQSGFIRELRKRIKVENAKAMKTETAAMAKPRPETAANKDEAFSSAKLIDTSAGNGSKSKRRASTAAKPAVPRAVSSIITSLLRAATRSNAPARKRKRSQDANKCGTPSTSLTKKIDVPALSSADTSTYWEHVPMKKPKIIETEVDLRQEDRANRQPPSGSSVAAVTNGNVLEQLIPNTQASVRVVNEQEQRENEEHLTNDFLENELKGAGDAVRRDIVTPPNGMKNGQLKSVPTHVAPSNGIMAILDGAAKSE